MSDYCEKSLRDIVPGTTSKRIAVSIEDRPEQQEMEMARFPSDEMRF